MVYMKTNAYFQPERDTKTHPEGQQDGMVDKGTCQQA